MSAIHIGQAGMKLQPDQRGWDPERGPVLIRTWIGEKSAVTGLTAQLRAARYAYNVTEGGANATVTATIGTDEDGTDETPINTWERDVNRIEKSIYEHSKFAGLTKAKKVEVKAAVEAFESGDDEAGDDFDASSTEGKLFDRITKGVESFIVEQPVVRLTETVSANFVFSVSKANIGKVLTYAQMIALEGAPTTVLDNKTVPSGLQSIAAYGYRKGDPRVAQAARGKWQVVTEWEAGFWDTELYTFV